jgi:RecB family exonuclease
MDPFVDQLASLCRDHVTRSKWVFVPSHAVGRTLGERIALEGTNWLNLRFVTPLDVALRMGAPFLVERGIDPSEEGLGPALVMKLLLELRTSGEAPQAGPGSEQPHFVLPPSPRLRRAGGEKHLSRESAPRKAGQPRSEPPATGASGAYFQHLADQPTMAQALWTTVRELRMAGVRAADLSAEAFESPAKHAELRALLAAYERYLVEHNRGDWATVYEEAMQHPGWCPIQPEDCWTELPDTIWSPLQRRLINAMPGERIVPRALEIPGVAVPRRLAGSQVDRIAANPEESPLALLMTPAAQAGGRERVAPRGPEPTAVTSAFGRLSAGALAEAEGPRGAVLGQAPPPAANLQLFHAGGREAEIEEVIRRILATGAPLDQVEIACASQGCDTLIWEKALRLEWSVTLGTGLPIELTRPGRALLAFCDWIESDFLASRLRRLLESGDMNFHDIDDLTAGQAARLLVKSEAGWGRATYALSLGKLEKASLRAAQNKDLSPDIQESSAAKAVRSARLLRWIDERLRGVPQPGQDGNVRLSDVVASALAFLESSAAAPSALDNLAKTALTESVAELRTLGEFSCPLVTALRFIRERGQGQTVGADRPRPGHLHVSALRQSGHAGRPVRFVVGVEEGRVFPSAVEDPVLLDAERERISPDLPLSSDKVDEVVYAVLARLAAFGVASTPKHPEASASAEAPADRPRSTLTFSYSCRDLREYRETFPSWLMLRAFRVQQGDESLSYPDLAKALGTPVSIVPAEPADAVTDAGWWISQLKSSGQTGQAPLLAQFQLLARGLHAEQQRASDAFTEFDGDVPAAGAALDPVQVSRPVSPTQLEAAADCAFRHFLERGLGIAALDEREKDGDTWLDAGTRGSELHDLYAALLRRSRKTGVPLNDKDLEWLLARSQARLAELRIEMPPPSEEVFDRESREFLADLELFVREECEREPTRTPVGFEVSFGYAIEEDEHGDREDFAQEDPVVVDLGGGLKFKLAGRIDRIDQVGASSFEVIDYKTGGYYAKKWAAGVFAGGARLQHALYGLAATQLLRRKHKDARVVRGTYYFPSARGGKERREIDAPSKAALAGVLSDLREVIASGTFLHATSEEACRFCDLGQACGASDALDRVATKLEHRRLEAKRRLQAHD